MKRLFPLIALFLLPAAGCHKPDDAARIYKAGWDDHTYQHKDITDLLASEAGLTQLFSIDPGRYTEILTVHGMRLKIYDASFLTSKGEKVTAAPVILTLTEHFNNQELLTGNVTTGTTDGVVLNSSGIFNLSASTSNGELLQLAVPIRFEVPVTGTVQRPSLYNALDITQPGSPVHWQADTLPVAYQNGSYQFMIKRMGWYAVARKLDDAGKPMTGIQVQLPPGFGNANAGCFMLFPDKGAIFLKGDAGAEAFLSAPYKVPAGTAVKLLCLATKDARYYYALKRITVPGNGAILIEDLPEASEGQVRQVIQNELN